jgi:hypothetical protein
VLIGGKTSQAVAPINQFFDGDFQESRFYAKGARTGPPAPELPAHNARPAAAPEAHAH